MFRKSFTLLLGIFALSNQACFSSDPCDLTYKHLTYKHCECRQTSQIKIKHFDAESYTTTVLKKNYQTSAVTVTAYQFYRDVFLGIAENRPVSPSPLITDTLRAKLAAFEAGFVKLPEAITDKLTN